MMDDIFILFRNEKISGFFGCDFVVDDLDNRMKVS